MMPKPLQIEIEAILQERRERLLHEMPEEREARLKHLIMRGRLATPGYSKCEAGY